MITKEHVDKSIENALSGKSNLTEQQLNVRGFSTNTIRYLFNNICNINGTYLEVGLFCGGTFVSSFNENLNAIGIENYAQDFSVSSVKEELQANLLSNVTRAKSVKLFYEDCFSIQSDWLPRDIDILFYDGHHDEEFQAKALPYFIDNMANTFLYIADDAHWKSVIDGTAKGIESLIGKIRIDEHWVLSGERDNDDPIWHNGVIMFLISKV
jgi:hypothetical protein